MWINVLQPESDSLVCDLIRFIVGVYHPSNAVLNSDIVPRWAVLGTDLSVFIDIRNSLCVSGCVYAQLCCHWYFV